MRTMTWVGVGSLSLFALACGGETDIPIIDEGTSGIAAHMPRPQQIEMLGRHIFFDVRLSQNGNQSCAACHGQAVGFTGPDVEVNAAGGVYEGSMAGRYGNRKPPASAYATLAPVFTLDPDAGFVGGNFWDGRATGWQRGTPAADQATGPFLNPVEQALPDAHEVVRLVCNAHYGMMFRKVWGSNVCSDTATAFDKIALSLAAFEDSAAVSAFSSKFDAFVAGRAALNPREQLGLSLFRGKARCGNCHSAEGKAAIPAAFTDFGYDNLGVPRNPENPFYEMDDVLVGGVPINPLGDAFVDEGLGGFLTKLALSDDWRSEPHVTEPLRSTSGTDLSLLAAANRGKQKVPTLRNVDRRPNPRTVKAYMHNGYFKSLEAIVHFYNTRDVLPRCPTAATAEQAMAQGCWPAPEVADNLNTTDLGNLGLTADEEAALVAFLHTLSDGSGMGRMGGMGR